MCSGKDEGGFEVSIVDFGYMVMGVIGFFRGVSVRVV